mmetsp:Transcript_22745/g.51290  ORF Transcript_22745/g.51290 Transcript_22745/m.51290 type:complete len:252 (+) Transcript_22745:275-1030(+)
MSRDLARNDSRRHGPKAIPFHHLLPLPACQAPPSRISLGAPLHNLLEHASLLSHLRGVEDQDGRTVVGRDKSRAAARPLHERYRNRSGELRARVGRPCIPPATRRPHLLWTLLWTLLWGPTRELEAGDQTSGLFGIAFGLVRGYQEAPSALFAARARPEPRPEPVLRVAGPRRVGEPHGAGHSERVGCLERRFECARLRVEKQHRVVVVGRDREEATRTENGESFGPMQLLQVSAPQRPARVSSSPRGVAR